MKGRDREHRQPLCGLSLEKPIAIFFPIYDVLSGVTGLGFAAYLAYGYPIQVDTDTFPSSRRSQMHNYQIVKLTITIASSIGYFFLAILLRKGGLSKNVTLLNLWVLFTLLQTTIILLLTFTIAFFAETFQRDVAAATVPYHVSKLYFCHVVRFYALELMHEHKMSLAERSLTDAEISDFVNGHAAPGPSHHVGVQQNIQKVAQQNGYQKHFEIDFTCLSICWNCPLGKGAFASVYKGHLDDNNYSTTVAVKVIDPENTDACCFKLTLSELKVMTYVGEHPNVVQLIGANTSEIKHRKLFIILEFCAFGSLLGRLRISRGFFRNHVQDGLLLQFELNSENGAYSKSPDEEDSISTLDLLRWSHQIANGMEFLASKRLVHGDLAARNVLLTDQKIAKISDFGLSRQLYQYSVYTKKSEQPVPWMNLAIESIVDHQFSTQSDVWSYGILLWEMFSLGDTPYPGFFFGNHFIKELRNGLRPTSLSNAPIFIHELMQTCWNHNPKQRPTFTEINELLRSYS